MTYEIAEKFKSIQGEGLYAGTPMAFIRFTGCSVGKKICHACDTDFEKTFPWRGGGTFTEQRLLEWVHPYKHVCLTGGEPLDQDLEPLAHENEHVDMFHLETSGTKPFPKWMAGFSVNRFWRCVSPKPGFLEEVVQEADEIKVIVPGLGSDEALLGKIYAPEEVGGGLKLPLRKFYWPTLQDALRWAHGGKLVYLQPRNGKFDIDSQNLRYVQDLLIDHPNLRLSTQMHKILKVQ